MENMYNGISDIATADVRDDGRVDIKIPSRISAHVSDILGVERLSVLPSPATPAYEPTETWVVKLNILIQVIGSRGDIQPFIALGNGLQACGHRVRVATHDNFEEFVRSSGLEFYPVGGDPSELMAYMVKNPGLIPSMGSLRAGEVQKKRRMVAQMLNGFWDSCIQPDTATGDPFVADAIIANPPSFAHIHCAQALSTPLHVMFTMPWTSTEAFPHPLANIDALEDKERAISNYLSYGVVEFMTWQGLGDLVNDWREEKLGLEHVPMSEGPSLLKTLNVPFTYCWSPSLIPKPQDWDSSIDICGFFFRDPPSYEPPQALAEFLQNGTAPVYIGFGSIVIGDPDRLMTMVIKAVKTVGIRAVISRGWSKLEGGNDPNLFYIGDCPHEWLFQRVAAVVHHGGAGTTACGLLNACPTVIVPFFGDQPFWGKMVAQAGAGPAPVPYSELTSRRLADAISYALMPEARAAASQIAKKMKTESGVKAAVEHFHSMLPLQSLRCDLFPEFPAVWSYKGKHHPVLLSRQAERIVSGARKLEDRNLTLHQRTPIVIEPRRWDPLTAVGSASLATAASVADATAGIITDPIRIIKEQKNPEVTAEKQGRESGDHITMGEVVKSKPHGTASEALAASAYSVGRLFVSSAKGVFVDIPIAAADGLRAVPLLYGEKVTTRDHITGFRSGAAVAGKNFGHCMYEAFTDFVVYTYHGKKEHGALGVAKGLGKGATSMATKTTAATVGLVAYPMQGFYRSIRKAVVTSTSKSVERALRAEGDWLLKREDCPEDECRVVLADFDGLCTSKRR